MKSVGKKKTKWNAAAARRAMRCLRINSAKSIAADRSRGKDPSASARIPVTRPSSALRAPSPRERGEGELITLLPLAPREREEGELITLLPLAPRERGEGELITLLPLAPRERGEGNS